MVKKYRKMVPICALIMTGIAGPGHAAESDADARVSLVDEIVGAASRRDFATPIRTFETYLRSMVEGDLQVSIECYSEGFLERNQIQKPTSEQIDYASATAGQFSEIRLESLALTDRDSPVVTFVLVSKRGSLRGRDEVTLRMIRTEFGWKIDDRQISSEKLGGG